MNWLAGAEATAVFALILLYIWWLRFRFPYAWILILALVVGSQMRRRETLGTLGLRWNTTRDSAKIWLALALLTAGLLSAGLALSTIRQVSWRGACLSLLLYCIWGLFQQYVLNAYFVNRLSRFLPAQPRGVSVLAGILFSLAHLPNWLLMFVALAGGYICARLYLERCNLYFLGLAHGIVGFLIYLVVPDTISHHLYVGPKWFG